MAKTASEGSGAGTGLGNGPLIVTALLIGFFAVPWLASGAPEVINGVLILLIAGALLLNTEVWLPYLSQLGGAFSAAPPATGK